MTTQDLIHSSLESLYQGQSLSKEVSQAIFDQVMQGQVDEIVLSALLTALKIKGETPNEIAGAAQAMVNHATTFPRPEYAYVDIVGTGGDGHNTINISSAAAMVAASCGVKVAKHGNRSVSSKSGSADLFKAFGLNLTMSPETARRAMDESNLCFLFAPAYHSGVKHAMPVRTALRTRTLFNLLGPLANPARPSHMMIGVYDPALLSPFAETLNLLGYKKALVVHGSGLDELALHGPSEVVELNNGELTRYTLQTSDFGLPQCALADIEGGEPEQNKMMIEQALKGQGKDAHRYAIAMNAAALIHLVGKADSLKQAAEMALEAMAKGAPLDTMKTSASISQEGTHE